MTTWQELFDRGKEFDLIEEQVREAVRRRREEPE